MTATALPEWSGLTPGPYAVGFRAWWETDFGRLYDSPYREPGADPPAKRFRPMLVNVWYPARVAPGTAPMSHGAYLELPPLDDGAGDFGPRLVAFSRGCICDEVMGKPLRELDDAEQEALERFLRNPTTAFRDAPAEDGSFPLVLNEQGLGAAYEDNTVFFEWLASHGYVVVNSAYQSENASMLNLDWDLERSVKDLDFLMNAACRLPYINREKVGVMGQSFGGQAALAYRTEQNSPVDAVVSLDATLEYSAPGEEDGFGPLMARLSKTDRMTVPVLVFTRSEPTPHFHVYDRMDRAERYYVTVRHLQHNDFIAHGPAGHALRAPDTPETAAIARAYAQVCHCARAFFDAALKGDAAAQDWLRRGEADVPEGEFAAFQYRPALPPVPTAKQLFDRVQARGVAETLEFWRQVAPEPDMPAVNRLGEMLLERGTQADTLSALVVCQWVAERSPNSAFTYERVGKALAAMGHLAGALAAYRKALALSESASENSGRRSEWWKQGLRNTIQGLEVRLAERAGEAN